MPISITGVVDGVLLFGVLFSPGPQAPSNPVQSARMLEAISDALMILLICIGSIRRDVLSDGHSVFKLQHVEMSLHALFFCPAAGYFEGISRAMVQDASGRS